MWKSPEEPVARTKAVSVRPDERAEDAEAAAEDARESRAAAPERNGAALERHAPGQRVERAEPPADAAAASTERSAKQAADAADESGAPKAPEALPQQLLLQAPATAHCEEVRSGRPAACAPARKVQRVPLRARV